MMGHLEHSQYLLKQEHRSTGMRVGGASDLVVKVLIWKMKDPAFISPLVQSFHSAHLINFQVDR